MGQMMSVRPDVLPQPALVELAKMQDGVEGFEQSTAIAMVEQELRNDANPNPDPGPGPGPDPDPDPDPDPNPDLNPDPNPDPNPNPNPNPRLHR